MKTPFLPSRFLILAGLTALIAVFSLQTILDSTSRPIAQPVSPLPEPDHASVIRIPVLDTFNDATPEVEPPPVDAAIPERVDAAPSWAVGYGQEFWRPSAQKFEPSGPPGVAAGPTVPCNLEDVIERVSHAFLNEEDMEASRVEAKTYTATIAGEGLKFSPHGATGEPDASTEVRWRTREVRSGAVTIEQSGAGTGRWSVSGNTAQRLWNDEAGVIEHYMAGEEGVAITWIVQHRPAGQGGIEIEAALAGLSFAGRSERGHHFADAQGTARLCVGAATLVDARGTRTDLEMRAAGENVKILIPAEALADAAFPIAIDPLLSPEFGMDEPVLSFSLEASTDPAIAGNGSEYLVVWTDSRTSRGYSIWGTRVSKEGDVLDPHGLPISNTFYGTHPAVASNGRDYLVIWNAGTITGTRVTREGVSLDKNWFLQIGTGGTFSRPSVTSDGTDYLAVWEHTSAQPGNEVDILAARVSSAGKVLDTPSIPVRLAPGYQRSPAVAWNGSVYLAVWDEERQFERGTFGVRLNGNGVVLDGDGFEIGPGAAYSFYPAPAVASNGRDFLVVASDTGTRVSGTGAILGLVPLPSDGVAAVAGNGADYLVVVQNTQTAKTLLVRGDGTLGATGSLVSQPTSYEFNNLPAVASSGGDFFVVLEDRTLSNGHILGAHVNSQGAVVSREIPISTAHNAQLSPAVASNGQDYLVVWSDYRIPSLYDIYGVRLSGDGTILDRTALPIGTTAGLEQDPSVASDGHDYFVAWQEYHTGYSWNIYGARVTSGGGLPDAVPVAIRVNGTTDPRAPSVASNGHGYLVAWTEWSGNRDTFYDIRAARIAGDGTVLDPSSFLISDRPNHEYFPAAASDGTDYLVTWHGWATEVRPIDEVFAARITSAGTVLEPDGFPLTTRTNFCTFPAVAFNGVHYLVAWAEQVDYEDTDIRGTRVSTAGVVLDDPEIAIHTSAGVQLFPAVASDGQDFLVAWSNQDGGRVSGAQVLSEGQVVDPKGFLISEANIAPYATLTALGYSSGRYLAVYVARDTNGTYRARGRFLVFPPCPPRLEWQASFGTTRDDRFTSIRQTADGGYILGGWSNSGINGDKTGPNYGHYDYWAVRLDATGTKLWDWTFGGNDADQLAVVRQAADGGFILGGTSWLEPTGNQTISGFGSYDFWLIRLDAQGNRLWERAYGGKDSEDLLASLEPTADGGWIFGGYSRSAASGNKSAPQPGAWVVRIDAAGNILWDRSYAFVLSQAVQASDGDFILAGQTSAEPSDYVAARLDANGQVRWMRTFGGADAEFAPRVAQTADGGFLLAGTSYSGAEGNKTAPPLGGGDFWVVRLDGSGNKLWDRAYGTAGNESAFSFELTSDDGFLLGGVALTEPSFGIRDLWVVRADRHGNAFWDQRLGGSNNEWWMSLHPTSDGGYVIGAHSDSDADGIKSTPGLGFGDYWVVKLGPATPGDCDGDGVPDAHDLCPDTALGAVVDANGCSADQRDEDGDGIPDSRDECPHTPPGAVVDAHGCSAFQRDADGDGVLDADDICPGTAPDAIVDAHGCSADQYCQPALEWQRTFGGPDDDHLTAIQQMPDGSYVAGGESQGDFWLLRIDAAGALTSGRFFGGTGTDWLTSLQRTHDGGFILGGWSDSPRSPGKDSEHFGGTDFWVVRLGADGNKLWDRSFGGSGNDFLYALQQTADGGFILGGSSNSEANGNKTSPTFDNVPDYEDEPGDFWVVRLDAQGNTLWEQSHGGIGYDQLYDLQQTADGGFILGGSSRSPTGTGNKTASSYGFDDFWMVRLDVDGTKLWDRAFGGESYDVMTALRQTADDGYLLAGESSSEPSGTKASMDFSASDVWVVRLDAHGELLWERTYGGAGNDIAACLALTSDGGAVLGGWSDSAPGLYGNRTSALPPDGEPIWLVRLDAQGNKIWDLGIPGGPNDDRTEAIQVTADGGLIVGAQTAFEDGAGYNDFWVLKFGPEDCDRDGVPDVADQCPNTPFGVVVDANGCPLRTTNCPPRIQWQASFGGSEFDGLYSIEPTADGGYILAGTSYSDANGNKTSPNPFSPHTSDLWLMQLDADGHKVWETSFGWTQSENALSVKQTADGGYIVAGWSSSGSGGTKTSPNLGQEDGWVIRLDSAGRKLWDRSFGGGSVDYFFQVHELPGGGFILGGFSDGGPFGSGDYWVVRTDGEGNKLWERFYGGSGTEQLFDLRPTSDGGFILGGGSASTANGAKTSPNFGSFDYWVVRVDALGNQLWDQSFGGRQDEEVRSVWPSSDGGFLLGGRSYSQTDGNKTSPNHGQSDYWIVRIADDGTKLWDRSIGGSGNDEWPTLHPLPDGGWILGGNSASPADGDKSTPFYGGEFWAGDYWIVRLDAQGNPIWDLSLGGEQSEDLRAFRPTPDGGLILAGSSSSGPTGNKTTAAFGREDWWVVKLAPPAADDCDADADGIPNGHDLCPETPAGTVVDAHGCSIAQLSPCDGSWSNHGQYVRSVIDHAWTFFHAGLIDADQRRAVVREAASSDCGKQPHAPEPVRIHLCPQTAEECRRDGIALVLSGDLAGSWSIEKSHDLIEWNPAPVGEATVAGDEILFQVTPGVPAQFYRVKLEP